jgi:hypothetical protein
VSAFQKKNLAKENAKKDFSFAMLVLNWIFV